MTLKEATSKFGNERAEESGIKEMKQMVDMDVMTPIMPNVARARMKGGSKFTRTFMAYAKSSFIIIYPNFIRTKFFIRIFRDRGTLLLNN